MFKKENRTTTIFLLVIILLVVGAVAGSFLKKDDGLPTSLKTTTDMVFSMDKQPVVGEKDAPVSLTLFFDYQCPHCAQWEKEVFPLIESDVLSTGLVNMKFVNYAFMTKISYYAAMAGELVHDKQPDAFLDFHNELLSNQLAITFDTLADKIHKYVPDISEDEAKEILTNQTYMDHVLSDKNYAQDLGISSTPFIMVGDVLIENSSDLVAIEEEINKQLQAAEDEENTDEPKKEETATEESDEVTFKTETDMEFSLTAQPVVGEKDAPINLTVMYDYHCPYCAQWEQEVFPIIEKDILSEGDVNVRFVNYAFLRPTSTYAAMAAELVQDKQPDAFLAFHNELMANQDTLTLDTIAETVHKHVSTISVKKAKETLTNQTYIDHVLADKNFVKDVGITQVPSVLVNGELVEDGLDIDAIQEAVQKAREKGATTNELSEKE